MAISKERLEELIEQGATIYVYNHKHIGCCSLKNAFDCDDEILYLDDKDDGEIEYLTNLFETKEDAEWFLEFGDITRTEKLDLPSWEEINLKLAKDGTITFFENKKHLGFITPLKDIVINNYDTWTPKNLLKQPLTKENYIEACRKVKELFLGGKDE